MTGWENKRNGFYLAASIRLIIGLFTRAYELSHRTSLFECAIKFYIVISIFSLSFLRSPINMGRRNSSHFSHLLNSINLKCKFTEKFSFFEFFLTHISSESNIVWHRMRVRNVLALHELGRKCVQQNETFFSQCCNKWSRLRYQFFSFLLSFSPSSRFHIRLLFRC